jgi:hypothetical protein
MLSSNALPAEKNQNMKACKNHGKTGNCLFFLFSTMRKKLKDKKCFELAALRDIFIAVYMSTKDSTADAKHVSTSSLKAAKTIIFFGDKNASKLQQH